MESSLIVKKYQEADMALKRSEPDQAVQLLLELVESEPREALFRWRLGSALSEMRQYPGAIHEFQQALELDPRNIAALGGLGKVYMELRLWELAEEAIQKRLRVKESSQHYVFLAYVRLQTGRYEEAIESCLKAIEHDPAFSEAYYNMGIAFRYQKRLEDAIEAFEKAVELDAGYVDGYRELGLSYFGASRLGQAKEALKICLTWNPADAQAHYYLALCSEHLGDLDAAAAHFEKARLEGSDDPF